ncbi:hypothetical protein GKZ89_10615 [Bacillus mangrovi]|uniref:Uncharacterized protein n=1 Tax=Metabacillus mangrovi TaxID=1491830 RepID=A0A7X2S5M7_9BACI|nr:hypothetical protein [Metabacillus mangrovi]MTH53857.1 hypothetical protein [Metabacillus mangrovi]
MGHSKMIKGKPAIMTRTFDYRIGDIPCRIDVHTAMDPKGKTVYRVKIASQDSIFSASSADSLKSKAVSKAIMKFKWVSGCSE